MCQLWGKRQQTVLGKPLFESVPYLKGLGYQERLEGVLSTGTSAVGNEIPVSAMRNGKLEQVYLTFIHQPIRDNTGTIISIISIVHEVTQQVVARQKIEASEARVQRLLDSMPQIAWTSNREGSNTYLNQQWYQFTGTRYAENFDETWPLYIHPDDVAGIREQRRASLATGEFCQFEYRIRNKAGEYRWHLGRILPLLDEKGNLVEWVGTATDIHEQKTRIDYLYKVLESIPHLAWTSSPEKSSVNFYNKGWYEYTGLTQEQSADQGWQLVLHSEDKQGTVATITEGRMRNEPWSVENRYKRFDGTYRWHVSRAVPIFDEQGRVTLWVGTATDIDDQRRTLEELQQTLKELHEKNFELDQFVYKTSHDLRSPLSTILGLINILKQEPEEATRRHYVDLIENRVHKLDRFIHSMLDYSRNTRTAARHEQIHFEDIYKECLDALEYMKNFSRLQISLHLEEGILYSDVFRLKIIFSNLISNAIKYQDFNKQLSTLRVQVRFQNQQVELLFADNGVGIEQAYQDKIYDMFFRATEQADGSGLGLYIVKQAVAVLSGKIELQSQVGIGTSFLITMPIHCTT
jgi:PAS domain S-box-containing protein